MEQSAAQSDIWLSLSDAAEQLGVHATTLRRWADGGEIQVMLTPGGHRRFLVTEIAKFLKERHSLRVIANLERTWAEQALGRARAEIQSHADADWITSFDEDDRVQKRKLGRQLMDLTLQYLSQEEESPELLEQARSIGLEHALHSRELGLPIRVSMQASMFFRNTMVESALRLHENISVQPDINVRLIQRINQVLDEVQMTIVEAYGDST